MPPKKAKNSETVKKMMVEKCANYNRGYCKFKDECTKKHDDKVCNDMDCNEQDCQKRHPNPCWHGFRCTYYKRDECLYSHVTFASDDEKIKTLSNNFNDKFKKMENSLKQLQNDIKEKDVKIQLLEENCKGFENLVKQFEEKCDKALNNISKMDEKYGKTFDKIIEIEAKLEEFDNDSTNEVENFECDQCKFVTESEHGLKVHKKTKHANLEYPPYECEFCDKSFGSNTQLKSHLKTHSYKEAIKCENCNFLVKTNLVFMFMWGEDIQEIMNAVHVDLLLKVLTI